MASAVRQHSGSDTIRFILDGEQVELTGVDPTRTVLQFLREDLGRIGTKEGCAEGDCGACTVVVAEVDRTGKKLQVRAINSCIQFLPTLDGKELITVESLQTPDGALHPVQQAMVDCHGSQCGFCTPGFIMSMFALYKNNPSPSRREIDDALAGNLCRCTGYRPIIAACERMYELADGVATPDTWITDAGPESASTDEAGRVAMVKGSHRGDSLSIEFGNRRYFAPATVAELASLLSAWPDATLLAGGTDVGLWVTKHLKTLATVIFIGSVSGLEEIVETDSQLEIGAAVSLTDAMDVLVKHFPALEEMLLRFASPPIRNAGTLVGNIANGSPIGDSMPGLMALGAELELISANGARRIALADFYLGYQETALGKGEFVERVIIPLRTDGLLFQTYKISKRFDQDISAVCGAFAVSLDGNEVASARIAYGGVAAVPTRAPAAEAAIAGQPWDEATIRAAMLELEKDFSPISDMRASAEYRMQVSQNLLLRFWMDCAGGGTRVYGYGR